MTDLPKAGVAKPKAFVSISIDIDASPSNSGKSSASSEQMAAVESVIGQLIAHIDQSRMPATWAVSSFAMPAISKIVHSPNGHEIALFNDAKLAKAELSRSDVMQSVVQPAADGWRDGAYVTTWPSLKCGSRGTSTC